MKKKVFMAALIAVFTFAACSITSCSKEDPDGAWSPMKWKTSVKKEKDGTIHVPSDGGTYIFVCTNYNSPWMADVYEKVNGQNVYYEASTGKYDDSFYGRTTPWLEALWQGNTFTVTVSPNTTGKERTMYVRVTAGDIFHTFSFRQEANK